jgi:DNA-nicking Smr family endonuclease
LTVNNLLESRNRQLILEAKESGTKQPDTELTDRLDLWQQYLNDIKKVSDERLASKASDAERRHRISDRRDDLLLGLNAKRVFDSSINDLDYNDSDTIDSNASQPSQRRAFKRRREIPQQEKEITVKVEAVDSLSKQDWIDIMAVGSGSNNILELQQEVSSIKSKIDELGSLQSKVDELASNTAYTNSLIQQLLLQSRLG